MAMIGWHYSDQHKCFNFKVRIAKSYFLMFASNYRNRKLLQDAYTALAKFDQFKILQTSAVQAEGVRLDVWDCNTNDKNCNSFTE